ncbi:MAG: hypothetical protein ACR2Q4_06410 [Geminicoccaceae bacterium]
MNGSQDAAADDAGVITHHFTDDGSIPNNPTLPLLIYPGVLDLSGADPAGDCIHRFASHGWLGAWRNGIYAFPHYHSIAHEALGICRGRATVRLGGRTGMTIEVKAGDALVLPAGTGHQNLGSSDDLLVVGAYPSGMDWDLCRGEHSDRPDALRNIEQVPYPGSDPLHGEGGPLLRFW